MPSRYRGIRWYIVALAGVLLVGLIGSLYQIFQLIHNRQADAVIIDLAGRQRMLAERHLQELLLASQGVQADHSGTGQLLLERVDVLLNGGHTMGDIGQPTTLTIPAAQTDAIRREFLEERSLLVALLDKAHLFLQLAPNTPEYLLARDDLLRMNQALVVAANEAVVTMTEHSESKIQAIIQWTAGFIIVAAGLGLGLVGLLWRTNQELNKETTERQHAQQRALEALQQSDSLKTALLSSVSHELRTPLTAIQSLITGVEDATGDVRRELIEGVREEVRYLHRLVENLLDMSRLEAGVLCPHRDWHVVEELMEGAIRRVGPAIEQRELLVELDDGLPPLYVDGTEIQLVLVNLLDNAVKFSPAGSLITLRASANPGTIVVSVSNRGVAIADDDVARIFDRFYRTESAVRSGVPGT